MDQQYGCRRSGRRGPRRPAGHPGIARAAHPECSGRRPDHPKSPTRAGSTSPNQSYWETELTCLNLRYSVATPYVTRPTEHFSDEPEGILVLIYALGHGFPGHHKRTWRESQSEPQS